MDCYKHTSVSFAVLLGFMALVFTPVTVWSQQTISDPGLYGYPVKYQRVMDYDHPYPDVDGFYVRHVGEESRPAKGGIDPGHIIVSVNGEPVNTYYEILDVINNRDSDPVTMQVSEIAPRFEQKMTNDPYYDPSGQNIYIEDSYKVSYKEKEPEPVTVYQKPDGHLYHRSGFNHTPGGNDRKSYSNQQLASENGLKPCPICFPEDQGSLVGTVLKEQVGDAPDFVKKLKSKHETVQEVPDDLKTLGVKLFRQRLRQDVTPRMVLIDTEKYHGFGVENGSILISRGLLNLMEGDDESAALVAHLMAHMDLKHNPTPVRKARFQSLIEKAIDRTTGVSITFEDLKKYSPKIPGFRFYSELIEEGYGETQEKEAMFFAMVYMYKSGMNVGAVKDVVLKGKDMQSDVHSRWLEYILKHPLSSDITKDVSEWQKRIPDAFEQNLSP